MVRFTIDARPIRAEGRPRPAPRPARVPARASCGPAKTPVNPAERCTFAVNASGTQFSGPDTSAAIWN